MELVLGFGNDFDVDLGAATVVVEDGVIHLPTTRLRDRGILLVFLVVRV